MTFYSKDDAQPLGNGHLAPVGCVTDPDLDRLFTGFKRTVASRYRALSPEDLDEYCPPGQLHVSPKIDRSTGRCGTWSWRTGTLGWSATRVA